MSDSTIMHDRESDRVWVVTGGQVTVFRRTPEDAANQVALLHAKVESLQSALTEANRRLKEVADELCGQGFEVLGWHLNGAPEPLDSWFEDNDWGPVEAAEPSAKIDACHDLLDRAGVYRDDGTHPQLVARLRLVVEEAERLRAENEKLRAERDSARALVDYKSLPPDTPTVIRQRMYQVYLDAKQRAVGGRDDDGDDDRQ
jgi:uncharacterized protein (UPF0335 family)